VRLGTPVLIATSLQSVYALTDLYFVGRLGEAAVGGLSISFQAFFLVLALSQMIAATALPHISQAYGAGDMKEARGAFTTFTGVGALLGIAAAIGAYLFAGSYVTMFTDSAAVFEQGLIYFRINALTFFSQVMLIVLGTSSRASGDFQTPMRIIATSLLLNIVLNPLLIFGVGPFPAMGIAGAAWASVISQFVAVAGYGVVLIPRYGDPSALVWGPPVWTSSLFARIGTQGVPAGLQYLLLWAVLGIVLGAMRPHGAMWTAAAGGGFRVFQQLIIPLFALGSASAALVGQNFGARHMERVRGTVAVALRWAALYGLFCTVVLFAGAPWGARVFATEAAEIAAGATYFRWSAPMMLGIAVTMVPTLVLQSLRRTPLTLAAALVKLAVLGVCVLWIVPAFGLGPWWVFAASTLAALVEGAIDVVMMRWVVRRMTA